MFLEIGRPELVYARLKGAPTMGVFAARCVWFEEQLSALLALCVETTRFFRETDRFRRTNIA